SSATLAQRQAELKTQFTTIRSAEGSLKTSVPGTLKTKLNTVLAYVNLVSAKLTAVHWNIAALAQITPRRRRRRVAATLPLAKMTRWSGSGSTSGCGRRASSRL